MTTTIHYQISLSLYVNSFYQLSSFVLPYNDKIETNQQMIDMTDMTCNAWIISSLPQLATKWWWRWRELLPVVVETIWLTGVHKLTTSPIDIMEEIRNNKCTSKKCYSMQDLFVLSSNFFQQKIGSLSWAGPMRANILGTNHRLDLLSPDPSSSSSSSSSVLVLLLTPPGP